MQVTGVNVGRPREILIGRRQDVTGHYKEPVSGRVAITVEGLVGDAVIDRRHHGGPDQAVYIYGGADYAWWEGELGRELLPGTFGENVTVSELESSKLSVGDRLHVGAVVLEITAARIPCATFAARMEEHGFVKRFRDAERPGAYCRVVHEGEIGEGDAVELEPYQGETATLREVFRNHYDADADEATTRRLLASPLAMRARKHQADRLAKLLEQPRLPGGADGA